MDHPFCPLHEAPDFISSASTDPSDASGSATLHLWTAIAALAIAVPVQAWRIQQQSRRKRKLAPRQAFHHQALSCIQEESESRFNSDDDGVVVGHKDTEANVTPEAACSSSNPPPSPDGSGQTTEATKQKRSRSRYKRGPNPLTSRSARVRQQVASWSSASSAGEDKSVKHAVTTLEVPPSLVSSHTSVYDEMSKASKKKKSKRRDTSVASTRTSVSSRADTESENIATGSTASGASGLVSMSDHFSDHLSEASSIPSSTLETPGSTYPQLTNIHYRSSSRSLSPTFRLAPDSDEVPEIDLALNALNFQSLISKSEELHLISELVKDPTDHTDNTTVIQQDNSSTFVNNTRNIPPAAPYIPPPRHRDRSRYAVGTANSHPPSSSPSPSRASPPTVLYDSSSSSQSQIALSTQIASLKGALSASATREQQLRAQNQQLEERLNDMSTQLNQERERWMQEREAMKHHEMEMNTYTANLTYQLSAIQASHNAPHMPHQFQYPMMMYPYGAMMVTPFPSPLDATIPTPPKETDTTPTPVDEPDRDLATSPVAEAILKRPFSLAISRSLSGKEADTIEDNDAIDISTVTETSTEFISVT